MPTEGQSWKQPSGIPYTANRTVEVLSKFFVWCEAHGYRPRGTNPAHGVEAYREEKRLKFMGANELEALGNGFTLLESRQTLNPIIAAVLKVLLFTGARCGEIMTLKWEYVDFERGIANLPDSKTGAKSLHLPPPALAILESLPRMNEYCFFGKGGKSHIVNIKDTWKRLLDASGLAGWRIHDLRHAFASTAASSGKSLPIIGKMLGHTQAATTSRYAHLSDNPVAVAVAETAAQIQKAFTGGRVVQFPRAASGE
jgi:integrase